MANQPSPTVEEIQLRKRARRRLVGAVTVVALMVTVLPMILDDEPKPVGQDIAIDIPSQQNPGFPAKPLTPATAPEPPPQAPPLQTPEPAQPRHATSASGTVDTHAIPVKPTEAKKPAESKPQAAAPKKPEKVAEKPKEPAEKPKETKPAPAKTAEAPHSGGGFIILLGSFLSQSNAMQRQAKLKEAGVKFYAEKIKSPVGEKIAVRAGPYPDRQEAERVLAKLKAAGIQDGLVKEK